MRLAELKRFTDIDEANFLSAIEALFYFLRSYLQWDHLSIVGVSGAVWPGDCSIRVWRYTL